MKLDYARNPRNSAYFITASVHSDNRGSTVKAETIGRHSDLLKITDDPLTYVKKKVVTFTPKINLNEIIPDPGSPASKPTYVNIGYFFLQTKYQKLMLDSFFAKTLSGKKISLPR